jgi:hypothetical protein
VSVHIELDGTYVVCEDTTCELLIHLPLDTVEKAQSLPYFALLDLIEAFDPPTKLIIGSKVWTDTEERFHRDHDLPAVIRTDGSMVWLQHDLRHRLHDRPAIIQPDGTLEWWLDDKKVR